MVGHYGWPVGGNWKINFIQRNTKKEDDVNIIGVLENIEKVLENTEKVPIKLNFLVVTMLPLQNGSVSLVAKW